MKRREGKVGRHVLVFFTIISIIFIFIVYQSQHNVRTRNYENKVKASQICQEAMNLIKEYRLQISVPIDEINDPNQTGLIGAQYTPITLDRADLSSALTSTNPNFSAMFIDLFDKLNIHENDYIAIGIDGSYPGLNLALYSAMRVKNLKPIIITTLSSSMWGADQYNLTWLDMEKACYDQKMFVYKSSAATLGGEDDNGRGFSPEAREQLLSTIAKNQVTLINNDDLESNIARRIELYRQIGTPKAFVNIGRSIANVGEHHLQLNSGLIRQKSKRINGNFVILDMLERKIPVINITDANRIARKYAIPIAPVPMQLIGRGKLFVEKKFSTPLALIFLIMIIFILYFVIRYDLEYYLAKKNNRQ